MSRPSVILALFVSLQIVFSLQSPPPEHDKHMEELKQHYDHLSYIAEFKCYIPQPRVIPVHDLFSESQTHGKAYFPDVTVLHRCDGYSGCCTSGKHCQPSYSSEVQLPFKITFLEDNEHHKKGQWIMEYYTLYNHTECACTSIDSVTPQSETLR